MTTAAALPRPTVWSPVRRAALLAAMRGGAFLGDACRSAGVAPSTLHRARRSRPPALAGFLGELARAEALAEADAVAAVLAGTPGWEGRARYLERRHRERWGRRRRAARPRARGPIGRRIAEAIFDFCLAQKKARAYPAIRRPVYRAA